MSANSGKQVVLYGVRFVNEMTDNDGGGLWMLADSEKEREVIIQHGVFAAGWKYAQKFSFVYDDETFERQAAFGLMSAMNRANRERGDDVILDV